MWQLNRFDGGLCNTAVNDNLDVNITSHDDEVKFKRDVGIQWSDKDIINNSFEIPNFSKSIASHLKNSAEARVNDIVQVRKQTFIVIKCFKWDLMIYNIFIFLQYQVICNSCINIINFTENFRSGNNGCGV